MDGSIAVENSTDFYRFESGPLPLSSPTPAPVSGRLIGIGRAAEILGVNQATLRQWGASGKVRTYVTPGGHRRFYEDELLSLRATQPTDAPRISLADMVAASRERYESLARRQLGASQWFHSLDDLARRRFRILGTSMLSLISEYLNGSRRERERSLARGREFAAEYGSESARLGLSLPEATEAFLLFRTPVLESLGRWLHERSLSQREGEELLRRANQFMDRVLVSMAGAYEAARSGAPGEPT